MTHEASMQTLTPPHLQTFTTCKTLLAYIGSYIFIIKPNYSSTIHKHSRWINGVGPKVELCTFAIRGSGSTMGGNRLVTGTCLSTGANTWTRTLYPNKRLQDTYLYSSKHLLLTSYDRLKTKLKKCSFCNYASTIRWKRRTARWQVEKTTIMF